MMAALSASLIACGARIESLRQRELGPLPIWRIAWLVQ